MNLNSAKIALFWDKSFLWGLIAYDTLKELGVSFELLTGTDIREGGLNGYDVLVVPGGWAGDKIVALGDGGRERIREYVSGGGSYLGICGGAGLALSHENGLGLAPISRMPTRTRVPSFSGGIELEPEAPDHPMWNGFSTGGVFHAWWPGQFSLDEAADVRVLARYGAPMADSFVTDLPVFDTMDWKRWEKRYSINLNPERIEGEPAVIEANFGSGKVFLSYLHFETPGDTDGHAVLINILDYLSAEMTFSSPAQPAGVSVPISDAEVVGSENLPPGPACPKVSGPDAVRPRFAGPEAVFSEVAGRQDDKDASALAGELAKSIERLVAFGKQNFLWYQRNDWILQWRRGVRGVEYSTLYAMFEKLAATLTRLGQADEETIGKLRRLREISRPFFQDAPKLLVLERDAMGQGPISPLRTDDEQILAFRKKLFSESKRCGGLYEKIIELADEILLPLLREELRRDRR